MNAIVIEHVKLDDLPEPWRAQFSARGDVRVTVRIEEENEREDGKDVATFTDNPLFGMWRDRADMLDVASYVRRIRAPRFTAASGAVSGNPPNTGLLQSNHDVCG